MDEVDNNGKQVKSGLNGLKYLMYKTRPDVVLKLGQLNADPAPQRKIEIMYILFTCTTYLKIIGLYNQQDIYAMTHHHVSRSRQVYCPTEKSESAGLTFVQHCVICIVLTHGNVLATQPSKHDTLKLWRRPNIAPASGQCIVFAGKSTHTIPVPVCVQYVYRIIAYMVKTRYPMYNTL